MKLRISVVGVGLALLLRRLSGHRLRFPGSTSVPSRRRLSGVPRLGTGLGTRCQW